MGAESRVTGSKHRIGFPRARISREEHRQRQGRQAQAAPQGREVVAEGGVDGSNHGTAQHTTIASIRILRNFALTVRENLIVLPAWNG